MTMRTLRYGRAADQEGDLYLPADPRPPVVCLLHGGFWKEPYGRDQMNDLARDLVSRGVAVWNLEYRRLGNPEGGWPNTLEDVRIGVSHLAGIRAEGIDLDLERVAVVGHSAGGHLALWVVARLAEMAEGALVVPRVAIALAPIADLEAAHERGVGGNVVADFLGGPPSHHKDRLRMASPKHRLPLRVPQILIHGTSDDTVPVELSRVYASAARRAGDEVELIELPARGHMEFLDPRSRACATMVQRLNETLGVRRAPR